MELGRPASSNLTIFYLTLYINEVFTTENIIVGSERAVIYHLPIPICVNDWSCILSKYFNSVPVMIYAFVKFSPGVFTTHCKTPYFQMTFV